MNTFTQFNSFTIYSYFLPIKNWDSKEVVRFKRYSYEIVLVEG